jgi:tRNA1Val (adenine37-N6)-methyltransferase
MTAKTDEQVEFIMDGFIKEGERIDDLNIDGLKIIQNPGKFCFGLDAVMLASFATVKKEDFVVDFGTGTGIIPIILCGKTQASKIIGIEVQKDMVDMAKRSVRMNNLEGRVSILEGDIKKAASIIPEGIADLVVSNPPYINDGHGLKNPDNSKAIARHEILCTLEDVVKSAGKVLRNGGKLAMIHRSSRMVDVLTCMRDMGIEPKRIRMIHSDADRESNLFLVEGMKESGRFLKVLKPLVIYSGGDYTQEIHSIYYKGERM